MLSAREFQIVIGISQGKNGAQIAAHLGLSPKSISVYRRRALNKLKLRTNADVVLFAHHSFGQSHGGKKR